MAGSPSVLDKLAVGQREFCVALRVVALTHAYQQVRRLHVPQQFVAGFVSVHNLWVSILKQVFANILSRTDMRAHAKRYRALFS